MNTFLPSNLVIFIILLHLKGIDFQEDDIGDGHFHRIVEAFKFTYGQRYYIEDPDFNEGVKDVRIVIIIIV